MKVVKK